MLRYTITQPGEMMQLDIRDWDVYGNCTQWQFDAVLPSLSFAYTMWADEAPVAIVYGYYTAPGVCDLLVTCDAAVEERKRDFLFTCMHLLHLHEESGEVRRWQIIVPSRLAISRRMARFLGFQEEGRMTSYYPDDDGIMYGRA